MSSVQQPDGEAGKKMAEWQQRLGRQQVQLGVIGLGYVGLPLALSFAERGFRVTGFDVDQSKVAALAAGQSYIEHLDRGRVSRAVDAGRLQATSDFARLSEPDALLICVPTPLGAGREPNLDFVRATAEQIASRLRPGQLVILESTTYPGTTEELLVPLLESSGWRCGEDFHVAFSPEREDPGNKEFGTTAIPKVVGGVDPLAGDLAEALYQQAFDKTVRVSSARAAEATKLMENIFRAVNIALVNELKTVYAAMDVDVWEVIDAAATKPFGFMKFTPGPGWGGHCIPVDPFYLSWKAREHGLEARFIELAGEICREMPRRVVDRLQRALNDRGKAVKGSKVLVLGIAYKPDIDDPRESPSFELIEQLLELGALVSYHDPHIPQAPQMRTWPDLPPMRSVELSGDLLAAQDVVLLATNHSQVDYGQVLERAQLVVDTRGVYRQASAKVVRA